MSQDCLKGETKVYFSKVSFLFSLHCKGLDKAEVYKELFLCTLKRVAVLKQKA